VAFASLATRLPRIKVDVERAEWRPGFLFRGLTGLRCQA
jgi:hypothetical protein